MSKNYMLAFPSFEERNQFVEWCRKTLPQCADSITSAESRPDLTLKSISDADIENVRRAPHAFTLYDDFQFDPSSPTKD